jgi:perosamine synthetase
MTNLQAALGVAQLERLDEFVDLKREHGRMYSRLLADIPRIQRPIDHTEYAENIYWVYGLVLDDAVPFDAAAAMRRLSDVGVGARPFFWPMHEQPVFVKLGLFAGEHYPVAERIARRGFYIPSGLALDKSQIQSVANAVTELMS